MKKKILQGLAVATMMFCGTVPAEATLIHYYDFSSGVVDLVGGENGTLYNGATVNGGVLSLNGSGQYAQFSSHIVPTSGNYTVALIATPTTVNQYSFVEMISQGYSGDGFYIGKNRDGAVRVGDDWQNTGVTFPAAGSQHHYAVTVDSSLSSTSLYIDGFLAASANFAIATTSLGTHTRLGSQFDGAAAPEFFNGTIDDVRIYDSALNSFEIANLANPAPVPEPSTMLLMGTGLAGLVGARRKMKK